MDGWLALVVVFAGGVVGGGLRAVLDHRFAPSARGGIPWGILTANLVGSLVLGALVGLVPAGSPAALLIGTGLCGALTTFSAFSLHLVELGRVSFARAAAYLVLSVGGGLATATIGLLLGRVLS